jgi:hypothetical protein
MPEGRSRAAGRASLMSSAAGCVLRSCCHLMAGVVGEIGTRRAAVSAFLMFSIRTLLHAAVG